MSRIKKIEKRYSSSRYNILSITIIILIVVIAFFPFKNPVHVKIESDTKIGIVDSGCSEDQINFVQEYQTFTNISYDYPSNDKGLYDIFDHGSRICKEIIDSTVNVSIFSAKIVHSSGILTYSGMYAAISWLVNVAKVDVINLSLGSQGYLNDELLSFLDEFKGKVIMVAASGNTGSSYYSDNGRGDWPAILPWIIGVGSYDDSTFLPSSFEAKGRNYDGIFTSEFSATGKLGNKYGTSFSSPKIAVAVINLIQKLKQEKIEFTQNEVSALLTRTSGNSSNFFKDLGWINLESEYSLKDLLETTRVIQGYDERESFIRFVGEEWTRSWKILSYGINSDSKPLIFSGNGTSQLLTNEIKSSFWGSKLNLQFKPNNPGNYVLNIENEYGNSISYTFEVKNESKGTILMDYRTSINSYGHQDGEFSDAEYLFRDMGYSVDHIRNGTINLENYDFVFAPRFLQRGVSVSREFINKNANLYFDDYINYMNNGGMFIPLIQTVDSTNMEYANEFFSKLAINLTESDIANNGEAVKISNFTNNIYTVGVNNFNFLGQELVDINNQYIAFGWYKQIESKFTGTIIKYLKMGIFGSYGKGNFIVFGSTLAFTNEDMDLGDRQNIHFDRVLINLLT